MDAAPHKNEMNLLKKVTFAERHFFTHQDISSMVRLLSQTLEFL
jgi:hypothetical protein